MIKSSFGITFHTQILLDSIESHLQGFSFYIIDDYFMGRFCEQLPKTRVFWVKANEKHKTLATCEQIFNQLAQAKIKRGDVIMGIGGGITLDIAAFCASLYKRGCLLQFIPTTLIAMLDACIGGKTAVNLGSLKNQIGSFYPAEKVMIDYSFLDTLPENAIKDGYAELIKMMLISERDFFGQDYAYIRENLHAYIMKAVNYKLELCTQDVTDRGIRQRLNLGHTFAHLYETVTDYRISHGAAVALGLLTALRYSEEVGLLSAQDRQLYVRYIREFCEIPILTPTELENMKKNGKDILHADKKAGEAVRLVLVGSGG